MNGEAVMSEPEAEKKPEPLRLERETCSRCGGSGHYSYCPSYGTTCFKCAGKKEVLTKRGYAALLYLKSLRSRPASELKPGDVVLSTGITFGGDPYWAWFKVESIGPAEPDPYARSFINGVEQPRRTDLLTIAMSRGGETTQVLGVTPETLYEVRLPIEEQRATLAKALEYQASLTKQGKPRKR